MKLDRERVIRKINANLINHVDINDHHQVDVTPCLELLTPSRFDILAKYIYAKHRKNDYDLDWAQELYLEHLKVWNGLVELDGTGKRGAEGFLSSYNKVLDSIAQHGFDPERSILPTGNTGQIIDGAHRTAACIAYKINPTTVTFHKEEKRYTSDFFRRQGLAEHYLDSMALEYARLKKNCYIFCIFPVAMSKIEKINNILEAAGETVYEKDLHLKNHGPINFIAQLYKGEQWLGKQSNGWPGAYSHVENRFLANTPTKVILYECNDLLLVKETKAKIRSLFALGNYPAHVNDTHEETVRLAEQLFNDNSIHLINEGNLRTKFGAHRRHDIFQSDIKKNNHDKDSIVVDSSSIMALYGLRDSNDLDYLSYKSTGEISSFDFIQNHNSHITHYDSPIGHLIYDPRLFLYYDSIKYLTLDVVSRMKKNRGEEKDITDIKLIDSVSKNANDQPGHQGYTPSLTKPSKTKLAEYIPDSIRPIAKRTWRVLGKLILSFGWIFDTITLGHPSIRYRGYKVFYSPRTSLVDRIRFGKIYEPDVTTAIVRCLQTTDSPKIIDVGANIGLMSLNILSYYPSAHVYAFEPGPHQFKLLRRTIKGNDLFRNISLYKKALSNTNGEADFSVHSAHHASGDGFIDTGRAGKAKNIQVTTMRMDDWWETASCPNGDLMKIDTEGAELLVLQGARNLITNTRPKIVFELCNKNLVAYSHSAADVFNELLSLDYSIQTLAGTLISIETLEEYMEISEEFIATPN